MNLKKIMIAAVVGVFVVPAMASAYTSTGEEYSAPTETLVEGHTVFATISGMVCLENFGDKGTRPDNTTWDNETRVDCPGGSKGDFDVSWDVRANVTVQRLGTAVAVLVRDRVKAYVAPPDAMTCQSNRDVVATVLYENPGVLWFNDQFLVGDDLDILEVHPDANVDVCDKSNNIIFDKSSLNWRYPCGGWVFATQSGNPDPRGMMNAWQYTESYQIVDPNDNLWIIDKYSVLPASASVGVGPVDERQDLPEGPLYSLPGDEDADGDDAADGDLRAVVDSSNGTGYDDFGFHLGRVNMWSVPVMMLDVLDSGPSSTCSYTPFSDTHTRTDTGVSTTLDYNAVLFFFFEDLVATKAKVHGEGALDDGDVSACDPDYAATPCPGGDDDAEGNSHAYNEAPNATSGPVHVHPTAQVDLYFSNVQPATPLNRTWAVFDTVGSGAPSHAHGTEAFDDRVSFSSCLDVDEHRYTQDQTFNGGGTWSGNSTYETTEPFRDGEGEYASGYDGTNADDCTGGYDGGTTGWDPSGTGEDGDVPTSEYY